MTVKLKVQIVDVDKKNYLKNSGKLLQVKQKLKVPRGLRPMFLFSHNHLIIRLFVSGF